MTKMFIIVYVKENTGQFLPSKMWNRTKSRCTLELGSVCLFLFRASYFYRFWHIKKLNSDMDHFGCFASFTYVFM